MNSVPGESDRDATARAPESTRRVTRPSGTPPPSATGLVAELRTPLEAVTRALHRLSLHRANGEGGATSMAPLIRRARGLAHELSEVIEEILTATTPDSTSADRAKQQTVAARDLLEAVRNALEDYVVPERVEITCPASFMVTTHPVRLHQVLVEVLALADRVGSRAPVRLDARRVEQDAEFDTQWVERTLRQPGTLDYSAETAVARALLRSVAGTIDFLEDPLAGGRTLVTARVRVPQQRAQDGISAR